MTTKPTIVYGWAPVREAIRARGRAVHKVLVARGGKRQRMNELLAEARGAGIPVHIVSRAVLDRLAPQAVHQGVIAYLAAGEYADPEQILAHLTEETLLVLLDHVEDPRNLGAILRTAHGAGAQAVVIPKDRAAGLTEVVAKTSAGAWIHTPLARVTNLAAFCRQLRERAVRIIGVEADGPIPYTEVAYTGPIAFVFGSEGKGLRRLTRAQCDLLVSIPMRGQITSLNVSVAVGIVLFEALRQRANAARA
ncbi:MAG: 23S rRNA (guanosine(2251)-2'-O)-methyltransferase RlmB [Blastocatellia bacterium]|nr:23S rRNA (guanosine(2251)-2'-O)-methyltransferase RlmB [Blastocatellia bacterium]MCS7157787.1 23S rRNA (guanosine(2251)-2'-O)-methyltransferase RlmB [Blastocatellia bacterium]MCX7753300.1 23S rRNA (guanosine(2251)-2'-O)-methyltransferase RlmB [Blastocatellia bacterium]MDW8168138.1 23S rRNA (guanosine(2251)-2'-O)-methyltransferase RlmB [Acidobacteriota bacterium]MDW8257615.1 23S rRNA (guanosine(2251)-2'-O)-methyltransferase RlmB [Acidobacteriota bacterium]